MKKIIAIFVCVIMLSATFCFGSSVSAENDVQRPAGYMPWYSFEDLNVGAGPAHTGDVADDEKSISINGVDSITGDYATEIKIGLLDCQVVEGGPAGKLLKYGAGPKMKTDNQKYKTGIWWPIKFNELGDEAVANKEFSNVGYFCFYVDMTNWSNDARRDTARGGKDMDITPLIQIAHIGDDGARYSATSCLKAGNSFELQNPDGSWKVVETKAPDPVETKKVTIPATGEEVDAPMQNTPVTIPTTYKGYVRYKVTDTYETTYYDATVPGWGIGSQKTFQMNGLEMHTGFYPDNVGVGGDDGREEPGYILYGDFGFMPPDPEAKPVADESKAEESKEEESKAEESKAEESVEEPSKVEASKADESVVPAQNNTETNNSHKGLWIALGVVLVVLIGGGVAAFFIVKKQKANAVGSEAVMEEPDVSETKDDSSDSSDNTDDKNE